MSSELCDLKPVIGPCRAIVLRWYYRANSSTCEQFIYGGCKGNANNFLTRDECVFNCYTEQDSGDICREPIKTGPCRGSIPRFGFDPRKGTCSKFTYGGCRGNKNNFLEMKDCERACPGTNGTTSPEPSSNVSQRTNDRNSNFDQEFYP